MADWEIIWDFCCRSIMWWCDWLFRSCDLFLSCDWLKVEWWWFEIRCVEQCFLWWWWWLMFLDLEVNSSCLQKNYDFLKEIKFVFLPPEFLLKTNLIKPIISTHLGFLGKVWLPDYQPMTNFNWLVFFVNLMTR